MPPPAHETIGTALRGLRQERGLGIRELARRAGTSKRSIQDWETDRYVPSGEALNRVLGVLEAADGLRARLLAQAAPRFARVLLADSPLGAPVDVGQVLRAMRLRQGTTQTEVARAVGVSQATLAAWESSATTPDAAALHGALFALGASTQEALALMSVKDRDEAEGDLADARRRIDLAARAPVALRDVLLLGVESELWWRATRDEGAASMLCRTVATRAHQRLMTGSLDEIDGLARRAVRLARSAQDATLVAPAVYAANWARQRLARSAPGAVRSLGRWSERMDDPTLRVWLQTAQGLAAVRAGEHARGVELLESIERATRHETWAASGYFLQDLVEARLLRDEPERALELLATMGAAAVPQLVAKAHLALGEEPPAGTLEAVRAVPVLTWPQGQEAAQIEKGVARVRQGRRRASAETSLGGRSRREWVGTANILA